MKPDAGAIFRSMAFALCVCIFVSGCKGGGMHDPVSLTESGDPQRIAQDFDSGLPWGPALKLDSASSIWVGPIPTLPFSVMPGDIAYHDVIGGEDVYPLVTAFVRHDAASAPSFVRLVLFDINFDEHPTGPIFAPPQLTGIDPVWCANPAVEVTYRRGGAEDPGPLRVHVVWSQLSGPPSDTQWDLYYDSVSYAVTSTGIDWGSQTWTGASRILYPSSVIGYDEIQPDTAIIPYSGQLMVVFNQTITPPWTWGAICYVVGSPDTSLPLWSDIGYLSNHANQDRPKFAPKVDFGLMNQYLDPNRDPIYKAAAAWTELTPDYGVWQVFCNCWVGPPGGYYGGSAQQITLDGPGRINALPQIDIVPDSTGATSHAAHQAVITWMHAAFDGSHYVNPITRITVTPDLAQPWTELGGPAQGFFTRVPDVACYQIHDPDQERHWFGISYYYGTDYLEPIWDVKAKSFSFRVEWYMGTVSIQEQSESNSPGQGYWNNGILPFTGSTLCLRLPVEPPLVSSSEFGLGWVSDSDLLSLLSRGTIQP